MKMWKDLIVHILFFFLQIRYAIEITDNFYNYVREIIGIEFKYALDEIVNKKKNKKESLEQVLEYKQFYDTDRKANYYGMVKKGTMVKHGYGHLIYDKDTHEKQAAYIVGEWKDNMLTGYGKYVHFDGVAYYEGEFLDFKYHGQGKYVWNKSVTVVFEGKFEYDKPVGNGFMTIDKSTFEVDCVEGNFVKKNKIFLNKNEYRIFKQLKIN
jgi:hypothetical protein